MPPPDPRPVDGVRDYTLLSLAALFILGLVLFFEDMGLWAMIPVLVGSLAVLRAKGGGPAVTLFLLLLVLAFRHWILGLRPSSLLLRTSPLSDALAGVMTLLYVAAHARLLSLKSHAVPGDTRRGAVPRDERVRGRWLLPAAETRRSASKVEPGEFVWLLAGVPVFLALAFFVWVNVLALAGWEPSWLWPPQRRALLLVWIGGVALSVGYAANSYFGRARVSREESLLYLQDQFWDATRGEQERVNRWVVKARLRRKERS